jgi:hypothetical protein
MDIANLLFIFLAVLAVLNLLGIALVFFLFIKAKKLLEFSKKGIQIETGLREGINDYTERVVVDWLSKVILSYKDNLEKDTQKYFERFSDLIDNQVKSLASYTSSKEDSLSEQISRLVTEARDEIEKYKKDRIENIDKAVSEKVENISREVLTRAIRIEEHEELVWDALEGAKNEGLFEAKDKKPSDNLEKKVENPQKV